MAKLLNVSLKAVVLVLLNGAKERAMLKEDLCWMDCHGLMEWPCCLKYKRIVAELWMTKTTGGRRLYAKIQTSGQQ